MKGFLTLVTAFLFAAVSLAGNCRYASPVVVEQQVQQVPVYAPAQAAVECVQAAPVASYAPVAAAPVYAPSYAFAPLRTVAYQPQQMAVSYAQPAPVQVVRQAVYAAPVQQQVIVRQQAVYGGYGGGFAQRGFAQRGFARDTGGGGFFTGGGLIGAASQITGISPDGLGGIGVGLLGARAFPGILGLRR